MVDTTTMSEPNTGPVDIATADALIAGLDRAEETPLYVFEKRNVQVRRRKVPGSKAILNATSGDVVCLVSSRYNILQHTMAFAALTSAVRDLGYADTARFIVENDGDLVRVAVILPTVAVPNQTGERIELGVRLTNSYNKTNSFHGELYLYRPTASGDGRAIAAPWARVGMPRMAKHHTTNSVEGIEADLVILLRTAIDAVGRIGRVIDDAATDPIRFQNEVQKAAFLRQVVIGQRHLDEVLPHVPDETTRWDLYTAVTTYTSLGDLTRIMRDNIADLAERRILEPKVIVTPSVADAEATEANRTMVPAVST